MYVKVSEQDMIEVLHKLQAQENTMKDNPKEKITMPIAMRAYQADAGVWVALMGAIEALRKVRRSMDMLTQTTGAPTTGGLDHTYINSAKFEADKVLAQFPDPEDLGA